MNDGEFHITYSYIDNSANAFPPGYFDPAPGTAGIVGTAGEAAAAPVQFRTMTTEVYGLSKFC